MLDVLLDSLLDTLKALPILFLVYLLVGFFSHKNLLVASKKTGPLLGSALGQIPQCGFSSVMADLYSKRYISMGTLIAVFLATSDEALPIMLSQPNSILTILLLLAIKFVCGVMFGYLIDYVFFRKKRVSTPLPVDLDVPCDTCGMELHHHHEQHEDCHEHTDQEHHDNCTKNIFLHALKHTLNITIYLLVASLLINTLIHYVGTENISKVLISSSIFQPLLVALIGLIPSCAVSVLFVELFFANVLSFGSLLAGLCAGAGLGLVILFTKNKNIKENLTILGLLYLFSAIIGMVANIFEFYVF